MRIFTTLVSDLVDDTIMSLNFLEMETKGYGTVIAYNTGREDESGLTISLLGNVFMTPKTAQNHSQSGKVRAGKFLPDVRSGLARTAAKWSVRALCRETVTGSGPGCRAGAEMALVVQVHIKKETEK
jgi:hypothetical protein